MILKDFTVTDVAGDMIGAFKNPGAGEVIKMTEEQAAHHLRKGEITATKKSRGKPAGDGEE